MLIYTTLEATAAGPLWLAAGEAGLCQIWFGSRGAEGFFSWLARRFGVHPQQGDSGILSAARVQLQEYFSRSRRSFDLSLDVRGTPFQREVWALLAAIPYGTTTTYGEIARQMGKGPSAARAVGAAVGANPLPIVIPCHRVLSNDGSLTGFGGGLPAKIALLELEGILLR